MKQKFLALRMMRDFQQRVISRQNISVMQTTITECDTQSFTTVKLIKSIRRIAKVYQKV